MVPSTLLTGEAAAMVKIRAYNARLSGKLYTESGGAISIGSFSLGTRVLLTCDVTGLPEGSEVIRYKWYHNCTRPMCQIQEGIPYLRAVADTLLVDVTSHDLGGRYHCDVKYHNEQTMSVSTLRLTVIG